MRNVDSPSGAAAMAGTNAGTRGSNPSNTATHHTASNNNNNNTSNTGSSTPSTPNRLPSSSSTGWGGFLLGLVTSPDTHDEPPTTLLPSQQQQQQQQQEEEEVEQAHLQPDHNSNHRDYTRSPSRSVDQHHVVLYYCVCLVGGVPGTLYVTQRLLWLVYGISLTGSLKRESLPLNGLDGILALENANLLQGNTVRFSFFEGIKTFLISPLALDCNLLRAVIMSIKDCFGDSSQPLRFANGSTRPPEIPADGAAATTKFASQAPSRGLAADSRQISNSSIRPATEPPTTAKKNLIDLL